MSSELLPLHLSVAGRSVVVAGGGPVAWRKITSLLDAGAITTVIAPYVCEELRSAVDRGDVGWREREYRTGDLAGAWLAFAATGDDTTDTQVEVEAEQDRIFCIRASAPRAHGRRRGGRNRSPAVLRRGAVTVGVSSTDEADPRRPVALRDAIGVALDTGVLTDRRHRPGPGRVTLVGGGPGPDGLLTVAGRRALADADVVLVDRLAPQDVLAELGPAVQIVPVGKAAGAHSVPQAEIDRLLVDHASAGRHVVRLKGGDPYLFGRAVEEVQACRAAGIPVEVIPGVSSAFAVPAAAGVPVTERGVSRQVTVLTGHDEDGLVRADWAALAAAEGTLVVLMGVAALPEICRRLVGHGKAVDTPVAVVENGGLPGQRVTAAPLVDIGDLAAARAVRAPAVVVIGAVARHAASTD